MNKYRNKPVTVNGQRFASKAEAKRHAELLLLKKAGEPIFALQCQPRFPLIVNGETICTYVGDFYYRTSTNEVGLYQVVEDVKGFETEAFKLKAKLFRALHPTIELRVVSAPSGPTSSAKPGGRRKAIGSSPRSGLKLSSPT